MDYSQELADIRAIAIGGGFATGDLSWPGEPFDLPNPTGDPASPTIFYALDLRGQQNIPGQPRQQLDFGGTRGRGLIFEVGICHEVAVGADATVAAKAELWEALAWTDTTTMVYRLNEAYLADGFVWQEVFWRREWRIPIERCE